MGMDRYKATMKGLAMWYEEKAKERGGSSLPRPGLDSTGIRYAELQGADLRHADLQGADLRGADLRNTNLQGVDLRNTNLWSADLQGADLRHADLRHAELQGADLRHADLRGANLWGANLQGANLAWANLWGVNLRAANLRAANFRGVKWFLFLPNIDPLHSYGSYLTIADDGEFLVCIGCKRIRLCDADREIKAADLPSHVADHYRWMIDFINHCTVFDGRIIPPKMEFKLAERNVI